MVQRTPVRGINRYGRSSQGVRLMNLRDDDAVSAIAVASSEPAGESSDPAESSPDGDDSAT
jgi:DNA gyrase subunit A